VPTSDTRVTVAYEYLHDRRVADRGITSYQGRPADVPIDTFYGNAGDSHVRADVHLGTVAVEHRIGRSTLRNRTVIGDYGRFYQNYVPGAVDPSGSFVALSAYNNATDRTNVFNQTDLTWSATTGPVRHTLLAGAEVGRQVTDNRRATGFFNNTAASLLVPFADPVTSTPVTFRPNATDADNHVLTTVAAAFTQDQLEIGRHVQLLGGVRVDRFDLEYHNNRTGDSLRRPDNLVSPRAGVVVKPMTPLSFYSSYSVSYLPSSGDQFSSLTTITQQVEPEKISNYEVGAKWDVQQGLSVTAAVYRLDRTNTRATDPNDPTRIVQTGSQRTTGIEIGVNGRISPVWNIAGGYAHQDARVVSATVSARAGATVGQVPRHTFSLWNNYQLHRRIAVGLGVSQRTDMFATIDNSVVLPGYWRADAAAFVTIARQLRLQVNIENLANTRYYLNADSNTNISPGSPRSVRLALVTRF
jgi:catecholate siderophore receptor